MHLPAPPPRDASGPLLAGGIVLISVGGLTFLLVLATVISNLARGYYEDKP